MLRAHDEQLTATGEPPGAYFLDLFVLNQWQMTKGCTSDEQKRDQLVDGLRESLICCGELVLCCSAGLTGKTGWEYPAPIERIWCAPRMQACMSRTLP